MVALKKKNKTDMQMVELEVDPQVTTHPLSKSVVELLDARNTFASLGKEKEVVPDRKSYTYDPQMGYAYNGFYRSRTNLLPYAVSRQMAENNELLAIILNTRGTELANFGHVQISRYDMGYKIVYRKPSEVNKLPKDVKKSLDERISKIRDLFYTCGKYEDLPLYERVTLPEFFQALVKSAMLYGFTAVEIIRDDQDRFHSFRLVDGGTIYRAPFAGLKEEDKVGVGGISIFSQIEKDYQELEKLRGKEQICFERLELEGFRKGEYAWVQVINEIPRMAFRDRELLVHPYYPSPSIEYSGYPRPPIDDVARSLTTNLNAMMHNHLFFFQGRATKGGLFIKSEQVNENVLNRLRLHMQSSINSVRNSFRMPVVAMGKDDEIQYVGFDQSSKDQEFAYLSENTAITILSMYGVDCEEVGMGYLRRGSTSAPAMSESNNENRLKRIQKTGFGSLLRNTQVLMNRILSIIDPELYQYCVFKFVGLDAEEPLKEVTRVQTEMNTFSSFNRAMRSIGEEEVPVAGNIPLNPQFLNVAKENVPMNILLYAFTGNKSVLLDPSLNFYQSGFWFQYQSIFQGLLKSKGRIKATLEQYTQELKNLLDNKPAEIVQEEIEFSEFEEQESQDAQLEIEEE